MASKTLIEMLNKAISLELQVSIQYMWQHVRIYGFDHLAIAEELKRIAIEEMKHAESIAERVDYLGGVPTTKPAKITVGDTPEDMITNDMLAEEEGIDFYKTIIERAIEEKDYVTRELFEDILTDEEDHHNVFRTLLEK
ncbi:MAG: ferritin-like domain-containing protein [Candidatus Thorarchaeota archaeon SMTZ1-83]|nr:MAG: ferritin [Candidatus Thorarchaeota archaeon SMTZ1-83]